jgi:hypothetical protein
MFISIHFYYVTTTVNYFYKYKASPKDYLGLFNPRLLCLYSFDHTKDKVFKFIILTTIII